MKITYYLLLSIILLSCKDDISDDRFRNENFVYYKEDGKSGEWLKIKPNFQKELPKSHSTYFFPNGNKFLELIVLDSFHNRIYNFYNKDQKLTRIKTYKSDSIYKEIYKNGYFQGYYSNLGTLHSEGLVEKNKKQGKWNYYYEDGINIKQIAEYNNGELQGVIKDFWQNGNLKSISNWNNGIELGEGIIYHENGKIDEKHFIKDGKIHGKIEQFYSTGSKRFWANSWYGIVKDTSMYFYENGALEKLTLVSLDTISKISNGKEFTYYSNGKLKTESDVKNDKLNGVSITYYENENIKEWMQLKNNMLNGKYIEYYETGEKKQELKAKNKYLTDNIYFFDKKGIIIKTLIAESGVIVDSIIK
ncbi:MULTISPECIES: toxin-antitoxin system YwqK family antitoxin [Winogradskyella]|uniref:toxin-antitoxin system YwqK family antitoxin n=1 Tax=Winogradskyella TaxID=286104 RepID=UPI0015CB9291|nr:MULTISPECIES: hypothetical protein [Winogradskyella]QXP78725.1 hypothetical protein H0I32_16205 [Winogradskyella sp. HaHa_3_26]